ncbi:MAG TPA: ComEC/Rec2 family competence protein [Acidocella sp.]|nr:ComEC/Rec2 family competence protein [Acidocella sp.]
MGEIFARWVEAEQGRFFLLLPIATGAAILVYFTLPAEPPLWLGFSLLTLALAALAAGWRHPYWRFVAILLLAASLGFARAQWRTASEPPLLIIPTGPVAVSGTISRIEHLPGASRITLIQAQLDAGPALRRAIRLKLRADDMLPLQAGEGVRSYALLFGPERPAWPGGWDMGRDYFFSGLGATGFALTHLTLTRTAPDNPFTAGLQNLRNNIAATILAILPPDTGGIAVTLLTGDEQSVPASIRQNFIAAGLAHILAVAGLHVGIIMGLVFFTSRWLLTRHERTALHLPAKSIAAILALLGGFGYALLTGAHLPILRALTMASLATLGVAMGRRAFSLRGLALAALALLLASPELVLSASFQMSFSAVAALIAGYAAVREMNFRLPLTHGRASAALRHVAGLAYTSLLAGGASMPFAAYQFQQIQPYWIPANLIAVPLTGFWILPWGLIALALMPMHLAALALIPMGWGIKLIIILTGIIAAWPDAMLRIPPMPDASILLIAAGLASLCIWRSVGRFAGLPMMALGLAVAFATRPPDVLVSADARLIALRNGAAVFVVKQPRASSFVLEQWQSIWGTTSLTPAQCTAQSCQVGLAWFTSLPACAPARLIAAPIVMPPCPVPTIDRMATYRNGAIAAWFTAQGVFIRTDRAAQGARPWVIPYPQP